MKKILIFFVLFFSVQTLFSQSSFISRSIRKAYGKDTSRKSSLLVLPVFSSAPETGLEIGGAALFSFYSDTTDRRTNVSTIFGYTTITTKGQTKLSLNLNYWTPHNKRHYIANSSFYNYPFNFYGVGNNTKLANQQLVSEKRYKESFECDFILGRKIYIGYVVGGFKYFYKYDPDKEDVLNADPLVQDRRGGMAAYVGPSITFDSRNSNTYATKGAIINAYYNLMHGAFINNGYKGGFFDIEYAQFFSLTRSLVLGTDVQEQSLTGAASPFYLLPQMGSDEMMRGYYQGRYRDRNYIAGQTELRWRINKRFGLAAFAGTGEVFHSGLRLQQLKPDYGGGIRYFFDVQKGLAVRLDYGIGQKPAGEPRETGFYIALGQSF